MTHHHHWLIEPPDGPVSNALCRRCGATRTFSNVPNALGRSERRVEVDDSDGLRPSMRTSAGIEARLSDDG